MHRTVHAKQRALAVVILTLCCGLASFAPSAFAAETTITLNTVGTAPVDMNAPLSFMDAVKVALARSDALRSTQIGIDSTRLTEKDTWYRLFPKLNLAAAYNVPILKDKETAALYKESVNISFNTGTYDPLIAYLSHDASKAAVKLAEMTHIIAIEGVMEKIALAFVNINGARDEIACRKELVGELESLLKYTGKKLEAGTIATLDHRVVEQRLQLARLELQRAVRAQEIARIGLKRLIGLNARDAVVFDTANATQALTAEPNTEEALQPEALMKNNLQLRAESLKVKLNGYNITLAKAEHVPKLAFGLTTPDPMSNQGGKLPYYVTMTATVPIWAWGETMRGVERAEMKHMDAQLQQKLMLQSIQQAADDLLLALQTEEQSADILSTMAELYKLESLRKEITFNAGSTTYEALISSRESAINKRLEAVKAQQSLNKSRIKLKVATGSLISEYVQVNYGELEKD